MAEGLQPRTGPYCPRPRWGWLWEACMSELSSRVPGLLPLGIWGASRSTLPAHHLPGLAPPPTSMIQGRRDPNQGVFVFAAGSCLLLWGSGPCLMGTGVKMESESTATAEVPAEREWKIGSQGLGKNVG